MRKYLYLAMAAASASVLAAPVVASAAPTAKPHVLTIGKAGGTAVKVGAKLSASLVKGTTATFSLNGMKLTCKSASFTAVVVKNPTKPGKALESLTAQTVAKCTTPGITIKKTFASNLPYNTSVSDAKGDPVAVTPRSAKKPIKLTAVASVGATTVSCPYTATIVKGAASNKGNTITITKQKFTVVKGSNALCPPAANFTAKFGPVKDISVKGSPAVFVN
ncbi:MAG TPA: hypothetical protein VFI65_01700 [Streptosporangiaceae bacterium]|nr:hypothetical protein [Streptosporangiaceae bacterium]